MLQICSLTEMMAETTVISIVPEDIIAVEVGLSDTLRAAWQEYVNTILDKIKSLGFVIKQKEKTYTLDAVLMIFANPSIEFNRGF